MEGEAGSDLEGVVMDEVIGGLLILALVVLYLMVGNWRRP